MSARPASWSSSCIKKEQQHSAIAASAGSKFVQEETVLDQSQLLSEAHFAMEHASRLKRLTRHRPVGRPVWRCVRALEEAALRMELEAKARSVYHWRAQGHPFSSSISTVEFQETEY